MTDGRKKELIKVMETMLTHLKEGINFKYGLCNLVWQLKWTSNQVSDEGIYFFEEYLRSHEPPTLVDQFYYWKVGEKAPRIEWLEEQIKILKG